MKKGIVLLMMGIFGIGGVFWYSEFSEKDHQNLDQHLEILRGLSAKEQKEKAEYYARLERKAMLIRQAFVPVVVPKWRVQLSDSDLRDVERRVQMLKNLTPDVQKKELEMILQVQKFANELLRSFRLERSAGFEGYALTKMPTPLFRFPIEEVDINKSFWGRGMTGLNLDQQNLIREVAVVLPPNSVLLLMKKVQVWSFVYYQVRSREFDAGPGAKFGYFVDSRFIEKQQKKPTEKLEALPSSWAILNNLKGMVGSAYVRGGSWHEGIPQIDQFFPSAFQLSPAHKKQKTLQGVDCSGLLYQATKSFTPRNTRQLLIFGKPVAIEGKSIDEIIKQVKPLDLIVWAGHVVIVYDEKQTIESRWKADFKWGVELVDLRTRLVEIMKTRTPVNDYASSPLPNAKKFVIRRWIE